jgi:hypothetical protein
MLERGRRLALTLDDAIASSQIMDQIEVLPTIGVAITRPSIAIMKNAAIVTLLFPRAEPVVDRRIGNMSHLFESKRRLRWHWPRRLRCAQVCSVGG